MKRQAPTTGTGPHTPSLASRPVSRKHASRPLVLLVVLCVAAVGAVLAGATQPLSASQFANTGHWVFNSKLNRVFHIDGATANIDAQLRVDGEAGSQVLQSDTSGYVVGQNRITEFDKASLEERRSVPAPEQETPVGIEVVGGPYAVYRQAGQIVRLGDPAAAIPTGGPIGTPAVTDDGTVWFHRTGEGGICTVELDAVEISDCPVSAPKDHHGALTLVDGRPAFVDQFTGRLHVIDGDSLGEGVDLGVPLRPGFRPAARDTDGRLAILDDGSLILVDTRTTPVTTKTVPLGSGDFQGPVSTGDVVAVVDVRKGAVLTFDAAGTRLDSEPIDDKNGGDPRLSQGEDDRIYVEDGGGTQVLVVATDGTVTDVDTSVEPADREDRPVREPVPGRGEPTENDRTDNNDERDRPGVPVTPPNRDPGPERQTPPPVPPSRPGAPGGVGAQPANGAATVTWSAAADNRAPITGYVVSWRGGNGQTGTTTVAGGRARIPGLANGVRYEITVAAVNRVGTGPAAATSVTPNAPVSAPGRPTGLTANYDENDRPTRDVTLNWGQPPLNGGTLAHYEVNASGIGTQNVTGTSVVYPQVQASQNITFTVRAVTRTPDGQTLIGQPATAVHENTVPVRSVQISQGGPSDTGNCNPPDCFWVNATMSGFDPDTTYDITLSSQDNANVVTEQFTTDGTGAGTYNELNYDVAGNQVWVTVDGQESNRITWQPGTPRLEPQIALSKGALTEDHCGQEPDCAWMHVVMTGFEPNTDYLVIPYSDVDDGYSNEGHTTRTDANGDATFDQFAYAGPGERPWVETEVSGIGPVRSNQVTW